MSNGILVGSVGRVIGIGEGYMNWSTSDYLSVNDRLVVTAGSKSREEVPHTADA